MALAETRPREIDVGAVEARTQAIGRELLTSARHAHARLSVLNRWSEQVLSWCMGDRAVKSAVLRLVDVLPSLRTGADVARHIREYFPRGTKKLPRALRFGTSIARPERLTGPVLAPLVRQLVEHVGSQFIAESEPGRIRHVIRELAQQRATCSLDILGEQVLSHDEADAYAAQYATLLHETVDAYADVTLDAPQCGPAANLSVKPTALTPRFDPICSADGITSATRRLLPIVQEAAACGAVINVDMEEYETRALTITLVKHLVEEHGLPADRLGVVMQAYLRDTEAVVDDLLTWLRGRSQRLTVRLVKGAYWDFEIAQAAQRHWPPPVYRRKDETDAAFERLTTRLLCAYPDVSTAIASHNVRSIAHAMAVAEEVGLKRDQLEFQLLYGMGEAIHAAIAARGYPVRIYTPIGQLIPGMAYLVRRLLENTANESFLRRDFMGAYAPEELLRAPQPSAPPDVALPVAGQQVTAVAWHGEPPADFTSAVERDRMREALALVRATAAARYPLLLGDAVQESVHLEPVRNPAAPEQVLGYVAQADIAGAHHAVQVAVAEQMRWARTPVRMRTGCLRRAAALMRTQRPLLAAWEVLETGKTWRDADADVVEAIDYLEYYSVQMEELACGRRVEQVPGERNTYGYIARGVTAVIAPWNFPLAIPAGMVAAALVTGNAVVFKPAEQSPITGSHLVRLLREAGVPDSAVQYLPGPGEIVGQALVTDPQVAQIVFTGSRAVGLGILETAGRVTPGQRFVKHVVTEMGGKNAIIVDADADLDAAVAGTLVSAFGYGGQKCSAASRLIVHEAIATRFLERLSAATDRLVIGDPAEPRTDVGPLIDAAAQNRLLQAAATATKAGHVVYRYPAERLPGTGYFVGPTIVCDLDPHHPLAREELFGPLLCVFISHSFAEALALANDSDYALTGGIYTRSPAHAAQAAEEFDVGNLYLNRPITGAIVGRQPFGGHRLSGLGTKAGGPDYLLQFLVPKTVSADTRRHGMPLE